VCIEGVFFIKDSPKMKTSGVIAYHRSS